MPPPSDQAAYIEVPASQVPEDHALCLIRDAVCRSMGLPALQVRYFRRTTRFADRMIIALSDAARSLSLYDQVEGFHNSERLAGLTIMGDNQAVWLRIADGLSPLDQVETLAHELRHQQQAAMFRTREGADADRIRRLINERPDVLKRWMEADATRYATETMRKLEKGEPI